MNCLAHATAPERNSDAIRIQRKCACGAKALGGGMCHQCAEEKVQRKLAIGSSNDPLEAEADRVAHQVLSWPGSTRSTHAPAAIQRFTPIDTGEGLAAPKTIDRVLASAGQPLDEVTRDDMEQRFGHDFSQVRVHRDASAAISASEIGARAYTAGHRIVFGSGAYSPSTTEGRLLLAHELTHVLQQTNSTAPPSVQRATAPEIEKIEDLLSYGVFDWAITDAESIRALEILEGLSKFDQATFFSHGKYLRRLRENLPKNRLPELDALVSAAADVTPAAQEVEDIDSLLSYGVLDWAITDTEAIAALEKLKKLSPPRRAVALESIDYARLLDNLPDDRKQEFIDLLADALGKTGTKETEKKAHPAATLESLTFTSDHGVLKDNDSDWSNSGLVVEPEWSVDKAGKVVSKPVSHTMDTSVSVSASLGLVPVSAPAANAKLRGASSEPALNFDFSGTLQGGLNQTVLMTSAGKLPNGVAALKNKEIVWSLSMGGWDHEIGRTAHTFYLTMAAPLVPQEMTVKRLRTAIEIIEPLGTNDPHEIVKGIMKNWNVYELSVPLHKPVWSFADDIETGGQCIDIVNFVQALIQAVGSPGQADAVVVWAIPSAPQTAIESPWGMGGMPLIPTRVVNSRLQHCTLLDGAYHSNNFEAALKFNHGGTLAYYPGGVHAIYQTPDQVLRVFRCMAWVESAGGLRCRLTEVPANYPDLYGGDTCFAGTEKTCYVKQR
jgi:hypothetical protein